MSETAQQPQNDTEQTHPPVDWIVIGANALCLAVVALAAIHAGMLGMATDVASYASATATF